MLVTGDEGCTRVCLGGQEASHASCFVQDMLSPGCTLRSTRPKPFRASPSGAAEVVSPTVHQPPSPSPAGRGQLCQG